MIVVTGFNPSKTRMVPLLDVNTGLESTRRLSGADVSPLLPAASVARAVKL